MPEVTPRGNPENPSTAGNVGTVVATPSFWLVPGIVWQQWMCAAVSFDVKPLNVTLSCSVWATGSSTIVARPVPVEVVGGFLICTRQVRYEGHRVRMGGWCRQD